MEQELVISLPNNINLELSAGTLTLKAGSTVYIPNGEGTFDKVITQTDISRTNFDNGENFVFFPRGNFLDGMLVSKCYSGPTSPGETWCMWYDTTSNHIYFYSTDPTTPDRNVSFPLCKITVDNGTIISIDNVFNGFGSFDSINFALPGISGAFPKGFNEDGIPLLGFAETNRVIVKERKSDYPFLVSYDGSYYNDIYYAKTYNIYQDISNIYYENKKIINGRPLNNENIILSPYDLLTTKLISQYANSEKILKLANGIRSIFSNAKLIKDWFNIVYNIKTAKGFGLDIWGKILNQGRNFTYINETSGDRTDYYLKGELTVDGTTFTADEIEELYRKVLFMKAMSLITNATERSINELLQFYFDGRRVYVIQYGTMKIRYVFEIPVNKLEKSLFKSDLLPKPAGVGATFRYLPKNSYFGFYVNSRDQDDQYWTPFDNKPFYW